MKKRKETNKNKSYRRIPFVLTPLVFTNLKQKQEKKKTNEILSLSSLSSQSINRRTPLVLKYIYIYAERA